MLLDKDAVPCKLVLKFLQRIGDLQPFGYQPLSYSKSGRPKGQFDFSGLNPWTCRMSVFKSVAVSYIP